MGVTRENETTQMWREYREAQRERRAARLPVRTQEILALADDGYRVERLTDYQFRIDGCVDLFPTHQRYHDLRTKKRGGYGNPGQLLRRLGVRHA